MARLLVGTRKGTFIVEHDGGSWRPRLSGHAGQGVNVVARDPNGGTLWALLGHGHWGAKLSRSDDDGATWRDNPAQINYPAGARFYSQDMVEDSSAEHGVSWKVGIKPATLQKLWAIGFGRPGEIHIGTIPGGLFTSRDGGDSFELNRALWNHESRGGDLFEGEGSGASGDTKWFGTPASEGGDFAPGIHSIEVDPNDPDRMLVAVSTAGVIETTDGGKSWHSRNRGMKLDHQPDEDAEWGHDTHLIQMCAGDPNHVWQQNHNGVYYSRDGAVSWTKVSAPEQGVHFGFPVTTDRRDGRVAWLVPGHSDMQRMTIGGGLFVARTRDGGQSWEQLREGLPQALAYDVVYRHALHSELDTVAFGSTTGNLYVSDDAGDTWQTVANNLPPIYSVRVV